jgi:hypothetical protein
MKALKNGYDMPPHLRELAWKTVETLMTDPKVDARYQSHAASLVNAKEAREVRVMLAQLKKDREDSRAIERKETLAQRKRRDCAKTRRDALRDAARERDLEARRAADVSRLAEIARKNLAREALARDALDLEKQKHEQKTRALEHKIALDRKSLAANQKHRQANLRLAEQKAEARDAHRQWSENRLDSLDRDRREAQILAGKRQDRRDQLHEFAFLDAQEKAVLVAQRKRLREHERENQATHTPFPGLDDLLPPGITRPRSSRFPFPSTMSFELSTGAPPDPAEPAIATENEPVKNLEPYPDSTVVAGNFERLDEEDRHLENILMGEFGYDPGPSAPSPLATASPLIAGRALLELETHRPAQPSNGKSPTEALTPPQRDAKARKSEPARIRTSTSTATAKPSGSKDARTASPDTLAKPSTELAHILRDAPGILPLPSLRPLPPLPEMDAMLPRSANLRAAVREVVTSTSNLRSAAEGRLPDPGTTAGQTIRTGRIATFARAVEAAEKAFHTFLNVTKDLLPTLEPRRRALFLDETGLLARSLGKRIDSAERRRYILDRLPAFDQPVVFLPASRCNLPTPAKPKRRRRTRTGA